MFRIKSHNTCQMIKLQWLLLRCHVPLTRPINGQTTWLKEELKKKKKTYAQFFLLGHLDIC